MPAPTADGTTGLSRRTFVRAAAVAGAAGTFAALQGAPRAVRPAGSDRLRVGLIGCGGRGSGAAVQALRADRGAVLFAMGDVFAEKIEASLASIRAECREGSQGGGRPVADEQIDVPRERCFTGFEAADRVIASCDVVLLTTPPHFRPAHLRAAVNAGRHVFCEKPVAVDGPGIRDCMASAALARDKGLTLVSGYCWRYSTRERETYERVLAGGIGPIRAIYTTYNTSGFVPPKPRQPGWSDMEFHLRNWQYFCWLSGDHMVEQAAHSIDKMCWAMGDALPERCTAVGGRQARPPVPETGDIYDHFAATFEYPGGVRGFHMCRHFPGCPSDNSDYIMGAAGTCTVNGWTGTHTIDGERPWRCESEPNDMYQQEHDELFASIRAGAARNDGERMCRTTLVAVMPRMAAYTGQVITPEQALASTERLGPGSYAWGTLPVPAVPVPGRRIEG